MLEHGHQQSLQVTKAVEKSYNFRSLWVLKAKDKGQEGLYCHPQ